VVFSDFQCPYCARIGAVIDRVRNAYPDKVKSFFKNFPLSSHKFGLTAAKAAVAADAQGKFWEFHDLLYQNYNRLNDQKIDDIRLSLNLDAAKFKKAMDAPETMARVLREKQEGEDAGVRGTPSVFVNGRKVRRPNFDGIKKAVEQALDDK
jgi:protein-disulfide isomerase